MQLVFGPTDAPQVTFSMPSRLALLALLLLPGLAAAQPTISGAARAVDGYTVAVNGVSIRLFGIDSPETKQTCQRGSGTPYDCGRDATAHLQSLIGSQQVACELMTVDRYDRYVALCRANGTDLGKAMVRDGWAVAFVHYSNNYVAEEAEARAARRGLWQGSFELPWQWRDSHPPR
jgi:endonuclease YncB( thermonuclease family)